MTDLAAFLADLQDAAKAATPGPWAHVVGSAHFRGDGEFDFVVAGKVPSPWDYFEAAVIVSNKTYYPDAPGKPDAAFIAKADPQVVSALARVAEMATALHGNNCNSDLCRRPYNSDRRGLCEDCDRLDDLSDAIDALAALARGRGA
jgi:hypothetical protein